MIPILYDSTETEFISNGIGRLTECTKCIVTEERNGIYECELVYPITGKYYQEIYEGRIIGATHDETHTMQPFDIYRRSAPINGLVTFYAYHISYRLSHTIVNPFTASSCSAALAGLKSHAINGCDFEIWTDKEVVKTYTLNRPASLREMLGGTNGSILQVFGTAEYEFDKFLVKCYLHRGRDTDVEIRYGKNLIDITNTIDVSEVYTAVVPFWSNGSEGENEEVVYLESDPIVTATGLIGDPIVAILDLSDNFDEAPTQAQLREAAQHHIDNTAHLNPKQNIEIDFVQLWQSPEYETVAPLQRVGLCDTVKVIYPELGINVRAEVIRVEYDTLLDRYTKMELGDAKTSFADVIKASTEDEISRTVASKSTLRKAVDKATQMITGGLGGHVVIGTDADGYPNEILIMDTDDISTAVNVIRLNSAGIGFSTTGYSGTYETAWTIDGRFVANVITTGYMSADRIQTGTIYSDNRDAYFNLDTGIISSYQSGVGRLEIGNGVLIIHNDDDPETRRFDILPIRYSSGGTSRRMIALDVYDDAALIIRDMNANRTTHNQLAFFGDHANSRGDYGIIFVHTFLMDAAAEFRKAVTVSGAVSLSNTLTSTSSGTFTGALTASRLDTTDNFITINGAELKSFTYGDARGLALTAASVIIGTKASKSGWPFVISYNTYCHGNLSVNDITVRGSLSLANLSLTQSLSINGAALSAATVGSGEMLGTTSGLWLGEAPTSSKMLYCKGAAQITGNIAVGGSLTASGGISCGKRLRLLSWCDNSGSTDPIITAYPASSTGVPPSIAIAQLTDMLLIGSTSIPSIQSSWSLVTENGIYCTTTVSCQTLIQRSDENLKNILEWDDRYDQLIDLVAPIRYFWKSDGEDADEQIGVSAQQVRASLDALGINNSGIVTEIDGILNVDYQALSMLALKRVKDLTSRVSGLEKALSEIREMVKK